MKFAIKNFYRNNIVNLTVKSIKYFVPDADIYCLNLYHDACGYGHLELLDIPEENVLYKKTKYHGLGPAYGSKINNLFFSEGYNHIYEAFQDFDDKLLMLAEDHFFTTGETLKELIDKDFDVAYCGWDANTTMNGSLCCIVPSLVSHIFPVPERRDIVETTFKTDIVDKAKNPHLLSTRDGENYKGDGKYSNDYEEIKKYLARASIV